MSLLPLQKGILYGPIDSRRLGKSLGINLMPAEYKLCSFNCVYCHYGWTKVHALDVLPHQRDIPRLDDVVRAIRGALISGQAFDYLTFSGNGEPTLYPGFLELVTRIVELRDRYRPQLKIALLSNSSGLNNADVLQSIDYIDMPVFKLDAGKRKIFDAINRPARGVIFKQIVERLQSLKRIIIQTVLVYGSPCNAREKALKAYFELIKKIRPKAVHIYSIDRPVPNVRIKRVRPEELKQIARRGEDTTKVKIEAFYLDHKGEG